MSDSINNNRVAVIGLGLLGKGIAACFVGHGFEVVAVDRCVEQYEKFRTEIEHLIRELVELGGKNRSILDNWSRRLVTTQDFNAVRGCSFAVESVTEDIATKEEVFDSLET